MLLALALMAASVLADGTSFYSPAVPLFEQAKTNFAKAIECYDVINSEANTSELKYKICQMRRTIVFNRLADTRAAMRANDQTWVENRVELMNRVGLPNLIAATGFRDCEEFNLILPKWSNRALDDISRQLQFNMTILCDKSSLANDARMSFEIIIEHMKRDIKELKGQVKDAMKCYDDFNARRDTYLLTDCKNKKNAAFKTVEHLGQRMKTISGGNRGSAKWRTIRDRLAREKIPNIDLVSDVKSNPEKTIDSYTRELAQTLDDLSDKALDADSVHKNIVTWTNYVSDVDLFSESTNDVIKCYNDYATGSLASEGDKNAMKFFRCEQMKRANSNSLETLGDELWSIYSTRTVTDQLKTGKYVNVLNLGEPDIVRSKPTLELAELLKKMNKAADKAENIHIGNPNRIKYQEMLVTLQKFTEDAIKCYQYYLKKSINYKLGDYYQEDPHKKKCDDARGNARKSLDEARGLSANFDGYYSFGIFSLVIRYAGLADVMTYNSTLVDLEHDKKSYPKTYEATQKLEGDQRKLRGLAEAADTKESTAMAVNQYREGLELYYEAKSDMLECYRKSEVADPAKDDGGKTTISEVADPAKHGGKTTTLGPDDPCDNFTNADVYAMCDALDVCRAYFLSMQEYHNGLRAVVSTTTVGALENDGLPAAADPKDKWETTTQKSKDFNSDFKTNKEMSDDLDGLVRHLRSPQGRDAMCNFTKKVYNTTLSVFQYELIQYGKVLKPAEALAVAKSHTRIFAEEIMTDGFFKDTPENKAKNDKVAV